MSVPCRLLAKVAELAIELVMNCSGGIPDNKDMKDGSDRKMKIEL
jgi:hypothetical protein